MAGLSEKMLVGVEKPARYVGGEVNAVVKNYSEISGCSRITRFGLCFPDVYEIAMSCLGIAILYGFLNERDDCYCERLFAPWVDMEGVMRERVVPLFSLETKSAAAEFDILGFSLQYELCYTNVLNMLDLAGIPLYADERGDDKFPLICAGGPCAFNPEPVAPFFDFFYVGEGEDSLGEVLDVYRECKAAGIGKRQILEKISGIRGVYVPAFYDVSYGSDGTISAFTPNCGFAPDVVQKAVVRDFENVYFPKAQIVPFIEVVHDRVAVEVFRGCSRGCRFCQAGFVTRPIREKSPQKLAEQAETLLDATGHEEVSLLSLSTGDYSRFRELADILLGGACGAAVGGVNLSLPSLRVDAFTLELMNKAQGARKAGLTFAPEAGSGRLRNIINKNLSDDEILGGCRLAFEGGWDKVKLYFMTGLPSENDEDLRGVAILCDKIIGEYYSLPKEKRKRPVGLTVSAACFVPKPFTPFQWEPQPSAAEFLRRQLLIKSHIDKKRVKFSYHSPEGSVIEALLARGDRRVSAVIERVFRLGAKFDGWSDKFSFALWERALNETNVDLKFYTERVREYGEILPWDFIRAGVSRDYLVRESEKARRGEITEDCRKGCHGCGASSLERLRN